MRRKSFPIIILCIVALATCGRVYEKEEVPATFELGVGTKVFVRPAETFVPSLMQEGDDFAGVLAEPLYYRHEVLRPGGEVAEAERTLIAPKGSPVHGTVVAKEPAEGDEPAFGVKLTSITFHGGMSFSVETAPVFEFEALKGETEETAPLEEEEVVAFTLTEPADVATVINLREAEGEETAAKKAPTS